MVETPEPFLGLLKRPNMLSLRKRERNERNFFSRGETRLDTFRPLSHFVHGDTGGSDTDMTQSGLRLCLDKEWVPDNIDEGPMTDTNNFWDSEMLVVHLFGQSVHEKGSPVIQGGPTTHVSTTDPQSWSPFVKSSDKTTWSRLDRECGVLRQEDWEGRGKVFVFSE